MSENRWEKTTCEDLFELLNWWWSNASGDLPRVPWPEFHEHLVSCSTCAQVHPGPAVLALLTP